MWALCAKDLLLLSLLLFIHFSCSICQTICLPVTPFLSPTPISIAGPYVSRSALVWVLRQLHVGSHRSGSEVFRYHFSIFCHSLEMLRHLSHPSLHSLQKWRAGISLKNKAGNPPREVRAISFASLPGLETKPSALVAELHPLLVPWSCLCLCLLYTFKLVLYD